MQLMFFLNTNIFIILQELRVSGMFSATFPVGVQKAAAEFLKPNYVFVVIGVVGGACSDVVQEFRSIERSEKRSNLIEIIKETATDAKILVFCNAKKGADFLAASLSSQGISTTSIHGDRLQCQREQALREFTQGKKKVLVATAVAARGLGMYKLIFFVGSVRNCRIYFPLSCPLDIPKVSVVVNYDLPTEVDEYVHRIGRTGRLGHTGRAVSFYEESQDNGLVSHLVTILKDANQKVPDFFTDTGCGGGASNDFASIDIRDRVRA
jgi:probable ATP-dependent RNA helicase DDX4